VDKAGTGAFAPRDGKPGRAYLAVQDLLSDATVMARLRDAELPCELLQIHPRPAKGMTRTATKRARVTRKPAAKKPAARKNRA